MHILLDQCYQEAIKLLLKNTTKYGILASSVSRRAIERNYLSVFARDASICSLGMVASGNKKLIGCAKNSLKTLAKYQAPNGQIPNFVRIKDKHPDFWYIQVIDSNLWWLIAVDFYNKHSGDKKLKKELKKNIEKAINWLSCQEHPADGLIVQNEASDWADIFPRSGKVLNSNALWYEVKKIYNLSDQEKTKANYNALFYPFDIAQKDILWCNHDTMLQIKKEMKPTSYYISYANFLFYGKDIDVLANSLAIIFNLPSKKFQEKIINFFLSLQNKQNKEMPMPVIFNPIKESSKEWRIYMELYKQNFPYQYHNGGIWPFVSCFWTLALLKDGQTDLACAELERVARANQRNNWQFNEWFHALTGKAYGMYFQSWNAAMYVLVYQTMFKNLNS